MATSKMVNFLTCFFVVSSILSFVVAAPIPENVVELKVDVSHSPFIGPLHGVIDSGQEVHLICRHPDYNPSELSWYHGDEKLEAVDCSGPYLSCRKLILSSVPLESSGNLYTCRGTELKEISWATIQIYVKESAKKPEVEMFDRNESETAEKIKVEVSDRPFEGPFNAIAVTGQQVNLVCLHQDYNPVELSWYHGNEKLEAKDCSGTYGSCLKVILPSVTLESSGNLYTCRGTELKETFWATVQIYVNDAPQTKGPPPVTNFPKWLLPVLFLIVAMLIIVFVVFVVCVIKPCQSSKRVFEYAPAKNPHASDQTGMNIPHAFGQAGLKEGEINHYESIEEYDS